jgi:hypothetical protein
MSDYFILVCILLLVAVAGSRLEPLCGDDIGKLSDLHSNHPLISSSLTTHLCYQVWSLRFYHLFHK